MAITFINQLVVDFVSYAQETLFFVHDPSKRIYWGFLLSSALFGLAFTAIHRYRFNSKQGISNALIDLINPKALFSRSTLVDIGYMVLNHVLRLALFLPMIGSQIAVALFVSRFFTGFVESPQILLNIHLLAVIYSFVFFIFDDFSRFLLHMMMHKVPFLWRFHAVHHSPKTLTPFSLYRFHPFESFLLTIRSVIVGGVISGVFLFLFAGRITGWDIIGVNAFGFIFSALGSNLRHSHIPLSFGFLERWFISPAQHQLHHSSNRKHYDINFGTYLAIWDRLFGSWVKGSPHQKIDYGL